MKKSKIRSYKTPRYPTRKLFIENPYLLRDHLPQSWKDNRLVFGALTFFVFCGLHKTEASQLKQERAGMQLAGNEKNDPLVKNKAIGAADVKVAPIFVHGEGHGAVGCVVVSPPVFLNEEEARKIIVGELQKENIIFDKQDVVLEDITFIPSLSKLGKLKGAQAAKETPLALDGLSSRYNIGYEYISEDDYFRMGGKYSDSTVQEFDTRMVAMQVKNKLEKKGKVNAGVFYDPIEGLDMDKVDSRAQYEAAVEAAKQRAEEKLKAQVQEFITWIKNEGLLK